MYRLFRLFTVLKYGCYTTIYMIYYLNINMMFKYGDVQIFFMLLKHKYLILQYL